MPADTVAGIDGSTIRIRPPQGIEVRACSMLLPEALPRLNRPDFLLAVTERPLRILGAAAHALDRFEGQPAIRVDLRVIQSHRRQGIGSQLLHAVATFARRHRIGTLVAAHDTDRDPDSAYFLRDSGFVLRERLAIFDVDPERFDFLRPLRDRLERMGKIPRTARVVSLLETPLDAVVHMQVRSMGGDVESIRRLLHDGIRRGSMTRASVVLLVEDRVEGLLLIEMDGPMAVVDSNVVAPAYRGGWANVLLKEAALQRLLRHGVRTLRFASSQTNRDTMKLADRCAARIGETRDFYSLGLIPRNNTPGGMSRRSRRSERTGET